MTPSIVDGMHLRRSCFSGGMGVMSHEHSPSPGERSANGVERCILQMLLPTSSLPFLAGIAVPAAEMNLASILLES